MHFGEYQRLAARTAIYPEIGGHGFLYSVLGLANEAGEVAGKVKKIFRDQRGEVTRETEKKILDELGDVLWYLSETARQFGMSLEDVAVLNLDKLHKRQEENRLKGSGDNR